MRCSGDSASSPLIASTLNLLRWFALLLSLLLPALYVAVALYHQEMIPAINSDHLIPADEYDQYLAEREACLREEAGD